MSHLAVPRAPRAFGMYHVVLYAVPGTHHAQQTHKENNNKPHATMGDGGGSNDNDDCGTGYVPPIVSNKSI